MSVMHLRHHAPGPGARIMLSPVPWPWVLASSTSIAYAMTVGWVLRRAGATNDRGTHP